MLKKVVPKRLYEDVIKQIENLIINEKLKPGEKLPSERLLAEKLSVGRGTLREAFRVLESNGIIRSRTGSGRFIRKINNNKIICNENIIFKLEESSILEFLDAREIIETKIVETAAQKATDEDIKHIGEHINRNNEEEETEDYKKIRKDLEFHLAIARASHNFVFTNVMEYHVSLLNKIRGKTRLLKGRETNEHKEHQAIFEAIKEHNVEKAKKELLKHLKNVRESTYKAYNIK